MGSGSYPDTYETDTEKNNGILILDATKYTSFLTGLSVSTSLISVRLFGKRRLHQWNSEQKWNSAMAKKE